MTSTIRITQIGAAVAVTGIAVALLLGAVMLAPASAEAGDTLPACTDAFHDSFTAVAQNGDEFPTWHPATAVDPATGAECAFGHEHGDDPSTSDIAGWTVEKLGDSATGITFGFAAHMSQQGHSEHRHEDHFGHKVFVLNDVDLVREDREDLVRDAAGAPVQCDYLIYTHQGSHSGDALSNNQHEMMYATQCSDGTEMVINTLTGYGNANEYTASCDLRTVATGGSALPNGTGGGREIPDVQCVNDAGGTFWGTYELWKADHTVTSADGTVLAQFDPWFGVRNPSRIADGASPVNTVSLAGSPWVTWPWNTLLAGTEKNDVASPFDGAQRDVYVQHSSIENAGGATTVYTDAYGGTATTEPSEHTIAQYVGSVSNTTLPEIERSAFGFSTDYGNGNGVHASN